MEENKDKAEEKEVSLTIRIPASVHRKLVSESKKRRRSLNQQIVYSLEVALGEVENGRK